MSRQASARRIALACILALAVCGASAHAATPHVDDDAAGNPVQDGSFENPFATIQQGINAAAPGDTVQVAAGTYYENLVWKGKPLVLVGASRDVTIVDGRGAGNCLLMENVWDFVTADGAVFQPLVEGFTFTNGKATPTDPIQSNRQDIDRGGGLLLWSCSVTIKANTIVANSAMLGAGVFMRWGEPVLEDNVISGNSAKGPLPMAAHAIGGGVYAESCESGFPKVTGNVISDNSAETQVGGVCCVDPYGSHSSPLLTGNTIERNSGGGGVKIVSCETVTLENNIIKDNAPPSGLPGSRPGGVSIHSSGPVAIRGNTIEGNTALGQGGGLILDDLRMPGAVENNTVTGNHAEARGFTHAVGGGIAISSITGGYVTLTGNTISGNSADLAGGGLWIERVDARLYQNTIQGNTGEGVYCHGSSATMEGNDISDNSKDGIVLAVRYWVGYGNPTQKEKDMPSAAAINGNTIAGNGGWGILCRDTSAANSGSLEADNTFTDNADGQVRQSWYGLVRLLHADGTPADGASVSLLNNDEDAVPDYGSPFTTNPDGYAPESCDPLHVWPHVAVEYTGPGRWPDFTEFAVDNAAVRHTLVPQTMQASLGDEIGWATFSDWSQRYQIVEVVLQPLNTAPVAEDDVYAVDEDNALEVAAPGVLGNDTDAEDDALTAVLVTDVAHGVLVLNGDGSFTYTPSENWNGGDTFTYKANDAELDSNVATASITVNPVNGAPVAADDAYAVDEDNALEVVAAGVLANDSDVEGDGLSAVLLSDVEHGMLALNADGSFTYAPEENWNGQDSFTYKANDGELDSNVATVTITVNPVNDPPVITSFTGPMDPLSVGSAVDLAATFTDPDDGDIHTAQFEWGDDSTSGGDVDQAEQTVAGSHSYSTPGVYTVTLTVTDSAGASDTATSAFVVIYDPTGSFVTGGGWIESPAGAYVPDSSLTGRAHFGFVSRYQKGAHVPSGKTDFRFHAAELQFRSTEYQWLVVAGAHAKFKGVGELNGEAGYGFMVTATDGAMPGGGGTDKFRIKIWDSSENVVYDNQIGDADDADATNAIEGGSIVIHKTE